MAGAGGLFLIHQRSIGPQITARHFRTDPRVGEAMIDEKHWISLLSKNSLGHDHLGHLGNLRS